MAAATRPLELEVEKEQDAAPRSTAAVPTASPAAATSGTAAASHVMVQKKVGSLYDILGIIWASKIIRV